jgi:hypothetical protein
MKSIVRTAFKFVSKPGFTLLLLATVICVPLSGQSGTRVRAARTSASATISQSDLNGLKVMNYYPSANSWKNMWTNWNPTVIDNDFALIASLNANTVRIIVNVQAFGYPTPSQTMLDELSQIVTLANNHGLMTQLTLFDWWSSYSDITGSETWASAVVGPYSNDPRIAFIELQNEIQPGNATAMSWAQALLPYVQSAAGGIPVTVSVTNGPAGGPAAELPLLISALGTAQPDFYDIHQYYGSPYEDFYQFSQAQQTANAQGLPLFIGETGASTNAADYTKFNFPQTQASYEAYQDYVYRSAFNAASALGLPAPAPWILWDFVPGSLTWVPSTSDQYNYGLFRVDGSVKPAAASVSTFFSSGAVDTSFNNGFENWIAGSPNLPTLWQIYKPTLGNFALDTSVAHSGSASVKIWNSSTSSSGHPSFSIYPIANVTAGSSHTASVYVMGQNATGSTQICLSWFSSSFAYLGNACGGSLSGTTSWQQISVRSVAPTGAAYVELFLSSASNSGTAWFDDVTFQ